MSFAFNSFNDFIHMGQHGIYVWSAWLITVIALAVLVFQSKAERQRFFHEEMVKSSIQKARVERLKQDLPE